MKWAEPAKAGVLFLQVFEGQLVLTGELKGLPFSTDNLRLIGEGFNTRVFVSSEGWVLKVAKFDSVLPRLIHEQVSLSGLAHISVAVPESYSVIDPCRAVPLGGCFYRYIEGRACSTLTETQQRQLGRVIQEIHATPSSFTRPDEDFSDSDWVVFARHLTPGELDVLQVAFGAYRPGSGVARFLHGDLWPENLIERNGELVGLVDWEQSGIGDLAIDFAGIAYLPADVLQGVLRSYTEYGGHLGNGFAQRLTSARLSRELSGVRHAIAHPNSGELDGSLRKVRMLLETA